MWASKDKGKGRATAMPSNGLLPWRTMRPRDSEGSGGQDGIVLPLQFSSDGPNDVLYTLPVLVGSDSNPQNLSLQVDTGSSDMWIASSSCSSSACDNVPLYIPTTDIPTSSEFSIEYLVGNVSGPIVWDSVTVGGYGIDNQAFAAADQVESEPLTSQFSGVLGLALPSNSIIAQDIPPQIGDTPDGAVWTSNLFGITPLSSAPASRFLSIALERPGSDAVPSVLGIGRHPAALVPDPSQVQYSTLYAPSIKGPLFWKGAVRGITVYTNSSRMPIPLGPGANGAFPSAVLDTGVPTILTTTAVANAIYGAIGVQPASNNMYYFPCTTPLNMTVTLDDRTEIPLHPLDLSTFPAADAADQTSCIGLIQASADAILRNPSSNVGDMVFGVPFLRNVYSVFAYDIPYANGSFPPTTPNDTTVRPCLGLLGLTNATVALEEFHRVRVLNQPLGDADGSTTASSSSSRKPSVGIDVLIGLAGFVGLCLLLFGLRWFFVRRSLRRDLDNGNDFSARDAKSRDHMALGLYELAQRGDDGLPTEDELRQRRYDAYRHSLRTVSTDRTQVEPSMDDGVGYRFGKETVKVAEPVPVQQQEDLLLPVSPPPPVSPRDHSPFLAEPSPDNVRHSRVLSVNLPLLPDADAGRAAVEGRPTSMAGVGAAFARGRSLSHLSTAPSLNRDSES